jgi:protein SCO1/2
MKTHHVMLAASAIALSAGLVAAQPPAGSAVPDARIEQQLDQQVPLELTFRDEQGETKRLQAFFNGRPVILVLAYFRCPRLCSLVLTGLRDTLRHVPQYEVGRDFDVITVSIDPRETPDIAAARKQALAEETGLIGLERGWHFLTGDEAQIKRLADSVGFRYRYDAEKDEFAHASGILVLTPAGRISRYYYGIKYVPLDVRFGLEDAAEGRIGSPVTRPLRLLCFDYDPASGSYSFAILRLVRIGGVLTLVALGCLVFLARRRSKMPIGSKSGGPLGHEPLATNLGG